MTITTLDTIHPARLGAATGGFSWSQLGHDVLTAGKNIVQGATLPGGGVAGPIKGGVAGPIRGAATGAHHDVSQQFPLRT